MYWFLTEKKLQAMITRALDVAVVEKVQREFTYFPMRQSLTDAESPVIRAINTRVEKKKALTRSQRPVKSPARKK